MARLLLPAPSGPPACWTGDPAGGLAPGWRFTTLKDCTVLAFARPELAVVARPGMAAGGGEAAGPAVAPVPVPVPAAGLLLASALVVALVWRRRARCGR